MFMLRCMSPKVAQSRHSDCPDECPLLGVKRTSKFKSVEPTSCDDRFLVAIRGKADVTRTSNFVGC
jgi:hypothetical protein